MTPKSDPYTRTFTSKGGRILPLSFLTDDSPYLVKSTIAIPNGAQLTGCSMTCKTADCQQFSDSFSGAMYHLLRLIPTPDSAKPEGLPCDHISF